MLDNAVILYMHRSGPKNSLDKGDDC